LTKVVMDWFMGHYKPESGNPRAYPLLASAEGMPPSIVVTAGLDPLQDQGLRIADKFIEAGVDTCFLHMEGLTHDFTTTRKALPSAQAETLRIIAAMRLMLGKHRR